MGIDNELYETGCRHSREGLRMFFNFTFRHFMTKPERLADQLQDATMRGFKKRVFFVFLASIILFSLISWWGFNTERLTSIFTTMTTTDYTLTRFASLFGSMIWSLIYVSFFLFGFSYILSVVTNIRFKQWLPLQLFVTTLLLLQKALIYFVFALKGAAVNVSFLSMGPLAATFIDIPFWVFFFNQLGLTTLIIIVFQYRFGQSFMTPSNKKRFLLILIGIHLVLALIVAAVGYIPTDLLLDKMLGGGVGYE